MKKKLTYEINTSTIGQLTEALIQIIKDVGENARIRDVHFQQDCYGDGTIQNTDLHITVEAK